MNGSPSGCGRSNQAMSQTFTIHGSLPRLNDTIAATKRHWSLYAKEKAKWTALVAWEAKAARLKPVAHPVEIDFIWYLKDRRSDPDNCRYACKHVLDGLVVAKVLPSDSLKWVVGFSDVFHVDRNVPRVTVTLTEINHVKIKSKEKE
jgi:hypothetical protein